MLCPDCRVGDNLDITENIKFPYGCIRRECTRHTAQDHSCLRPAGTVKHRGRTHLISQNIPVDTILVAFRQVYLDYSGLDEDLPGHHFLELVNKDCNRLYNGRGILDVQAPGNAIERVCPAAWCNDLFDGIFYHVVRVRIFGTGPGKSEVALQTRCGFRLACTQHITPDIKGCCEVCIEKVQSECSLLEWSNANDLLRYLIIQIEILQEFLQHGGGGYFFKIEGHTLFPIDYGGIDNEVHTHSPG